MAYTLAVIASISLRLMADRVLTADKVRNGQRRNPVCVSMSLAAVVILIRLSARSG